MNLRRTSVRQRRRSPYAPPTGAWVAIAFGLFVLLCLFS